MNSASWNPPIYCWQLPPCSSSSESIGSPLVSNSLESKSLSLSHQPHQPDVPDLPSRPNETDSPEPQSSPTVDSQKPLWSDLPLVLSRDPGLPNPLRQISLLPTPSQSLRHQSTQMQTIKTIKTITTYLRVRGLLFR